MEYRRDRVALSIYLASQLFEATADLVRLNPHPAPSPAELFDRFLAWTARPPTRAGTAPVPGDVHPPSPDPDQSRIRNTNRKPART
ncbi:hypothetical protein AB0K20_03845 [Micromonospora matsumotoense]|uniref:hypothetical protein n=1 Tax=Micromonospora matsumotoense TaxID=121616 RepID=UPI0034446B84